MNPVASPIAFPAESLDPDAVDIVTRLQAAGYTTYLVGGCVRDILLGRQPKDFDIATAARPEELKRVFGRRCRIIGRRFRLGHVHVGPKVFEVATFRGLPDDQETAADDSGFVVRANSFGPPEEDARSRDFTVNGLFYDPAARTLLDWVDGRRDLRARVMRTIGAADDRLREDPVRLLRAIKLATRLDFTVDTDITEIAPEIAQLINTCPVARVTEEIFRICESGHARGAFEMMVDLGVIDALLPEIKGHFEVDSATRDYLFTWFDQLDRQTRTHGTLPRTAIYVLFAWPFVKLAIDDRTDRDSLEWGRFARAATHDFAVRLGIPVRHRQMLEFTAELLRRMQSTRQRRPTRGQLRSKALPFALTIARMDFVLRGGRQETYDLWASEAERIDVSPAPFEPRDDDATAAPPEPRPAKRTRRRRRR